MQKQPFLSSAVHNCALLLVFCLLFAPLNAQEQIGRPLINNYAYRDYEGAPINWWALEDEDGIMYFANNAGILQYDGVNWRNIELPVGGTRCLTKDDKGTIYVGSNGEFGYLEPNEVGELKYVSLVDKIPEEHRVFSDVWEVDYFKGRVIFRTQFKLYCWDGSTMKVITSEQGYHVGAIVRDTYYLRIWGRGLCYLTEEDTFELVPEGEQFANERIYVILPYDENNILIGTRNLGYFLFDGNTFTPFDTEVDEYTKGDIYLPGVAMDDGRFVINSFSDGAFLMGHDGRLIQKYTVENGLQDGAVDYTYVDSRGILWLALFNGISSVNLKNNFTFLDKNMGLPTNVVFSVYRFKDILYLSTNDGIAYLDEENKRIIPIEGTFGQGGNFVEFKDRLFVGTGDMGLLEIKDKRFEYVRQSRNYDLRVGNIYQSKIDENRIIVPHQQGIAFFYFDTQANNFVLEHNIEGYSFSGGADVIAEREDGNIWLNSDEKGVVLLLKLNYKDDKIIPEAVEEIVYGEDKGLPDYRIYFSDIDGEIHFYSTREGKGTYIFNQEEDRFEKAKFFYNDLINWERGGTWTPFTAKDSEGRTWLNKGSGVFFAQKDSAGKWVVNTEVFRELKNYILWDIYPEDPAPDGTQVVWISGPDGVVRYEGKLEDPSNPNFEVKIRNLSVSGDSLLYAGNIDFPENFEIPYESNSVSLSYAAPFYIGQKEMQYSTQLQGIDDDWSDWTKQTTREYINLPFGNYTFKVKAQNIYGDISTESSVSFKISTPWYRTWWAYMLYLLLFMAIVYFVVKVRTGLLIAQREMLEDKVELRTREVQQRLNELATVNSVSQALNDKLELDKLINLVGDKMKEVFKSDITYLAILDKETNIINFPYQDGDNMPPMKLGEGLTSRIIQTGEPLLINRDKDIVAEYDKYGLKQTGKQAVSYLGVPISVEDDIIGVLSVQSMTQEGRFNEEDKNLLGTIAINVGVALHNAELYEEAKEAKARAEDANEAKSAFLSTVSHELRTPLTSVLGFAKIIRKRLEDKIFPVVSVNDQKIKKTMKQVSENLEVVVSEGERLTSLINDVLDLAKIESGRMDWNMKPIFIQDILSRAMSATSSLFENKKLALKKKIPKDLPLISGDEDKLIQVVINLLSNAVKFTEKGTVTIEAYQDKGQIIVEVQDTGIGIAETDKHKVFERFRQAGDTLTDKPQGTGLGLPICREIIEHHGGIIWMNSELNVGSTFFFSVPTLGESNEQPIQLERILKSLKKQIKHSSKKTLEDIPTILVVDDDTPIRSLLRQELSDAGYNVKEAADGKAALDMVRVSKPDLIILDVMMPEINGFDVAAVLKNDPATMDIPIIILSIVQDKERGLRIGVDRYLTKPIDTEKLFHEVDELLEQGVSKKRVLVVDEDASTVKSLTDVLTARGYKVVEANPDKLLETASEIKPDIIMLNSLHENGDKSIKELKFQKGMENVMFFVYQ
ncbi:response regulator [Robiginitalea sp. IMCC43444]|uniref:response regulator n=1 Tax=Robiginitalea sp. IMCC43444 TaxID=3459121 RepID=UPI004042E843